MPDAVPTVRWRDNPKEYCRQYAAIHRAEINQMSRSWAARNKEKRKETQRKYAEAHSQEIKTKALKKYWENREELLSRGKRYRLMKPGARVEYARKYRQQNKARIAKYRKEISKTDEYKAYYRVYQNRRRAAVKNAQKDQAAILKSLYNQTKNNLWTRCYYCGKRIRGRDSHLDHIVPIIKGGAHSSENLCISCPACNLSKNGKLVNEWRGTNQLHLL